jgi:hypothetical protein
MYTKKDGDSSTVNPILLKGTKGVIDKPAGQAPVPRCVPPCLLPGAVTSGGWKLT